MNIQQLEDMLAIMKKLNLGEVRCLDEMSGTSCEVEIKNVLIDKEGALVTDKRKSQVNEQPYSRAEYLKIFNEDPYLMKTYPSFEDFYAFIEDSRKREIRLIQGAQEVMLLSPAMPRVSK